MRAQKAQFQTPLASLQPIRDLSRHERRRVAFIADVDERTVARRLRGMLTKPGARERIDRALAELGLIERAEGDAASPLNDLVAKAASR